MANLPVFTTIFGGSMYAIIRAGGKQYKVQAGDTVRVEKMEKNLGDAFNLTEVLMIGGDTPIMGSPLVQNATVAVVVTRQAKNPKIIVFKKKRRQGYRKMQGHRQLFTELFVKSISAGGQTSNTDKKAVVIDPLKNEARKTEFAAQQKASGVKAVAKKAPAKKSAPKKVTAKKAAGKKTVAKKKTAGKKTAKKTTKKSSK